jgi:hypothetical protein
MNTGPNVRLHLYFAKQSSRVVILRQGASKVFRMILWDRANDHFEDGQWLKHKVYTERCDISPDGAHFLYFALNGDWSGASKGSYTVICRPPWFTALALFPQGDTWGGGGMFIDNRRFIVNTADSTVDIVGQATGLERVTRFPAKQANAGLIESANRLVKGRRKRVAMDAASESVERSEGSNGKDLPGVQDEVPWTDFYETLSGCLYRKSGNDLHLIRDFTDMTFKQIAAPYTSLGGDGSAPPWHPLDKDQA